MKGSRVLIRAKGRGLCIERGLHDCLQKELFTDVCLNCSGGKVRANKGVLAAASNVFSRLLKDWPISEDPCIVMAGYTAEEVQGLIRYIYTGQVSAPIAKESTWQKMIEDFEIGVQPMDESDCVDEHNSTDEPVSQANEILEKVRSPEISPPQRLPKLSLPKISKRSKPVGPKIVSVSSPRPFVVKVQSAITAQNAANGDTLAKPEMRNDSAGDCDVPVSNPQKRSRKAPKLLLGKQLDDSAQATAVLKRTATKHEKEHCASPSKKRFVCPYCQRRFLTRGNVKNHIRIHTRERPFTCAVCRDIFTYLGVYQRHLLKHREANDITVEEFERLISEAMQSAAEHTNSFDESSIRIDETEQRIRLPSGGNPADVTSKRKATGVAEKCADEGEEPQQETSEEPTDETVEEPSEQLMEEPSEDSVMEPAEASTEETENTMDETEKSIEESMEDTAKSTEEPLEDVDKPAEEPMEETEKSTEEPNDDDSSTDYLIADEEIIIASKLRNKGETQKDDKTDEGLPGRQENRSETDGVNPTDQLIEGSKDTLISSVNVEENKTEEDGSVIQVIQCDLCPRKFGKWSALYVHRCAHTGEVPLIHCSVCNEHFSSIEALKEHKKTHRQDQAFHCEKCEKKFTSNRALKAHTLVHTFRLTVQCRFCSKAMRNVRERQAHERRHRAKKPREAAEPVAEVAESAVEIFETASETAGTANDAQAVEAKEATETPVSESQVLEES